MRGVIGMLSRACARGCDEVQGQVDRRLVGAVGAEATEESQLKTVSTIVGTMTKLNASLEPWVVYLKPMHENPELSWFETTGRAAEDAETPARPRRSALAVWRRWRSLAGCAACAVVGAGGPSRLPERASLPPAPNQELDFMAVRYSSEPRTRQLDHPHAQEPDFPK
jgi:hypothetical protein